ncbi:MAG: hypothetical protein ABIP17_14175 [Ilumatobacteraceae bacterium]
MNQVKTRLQALGLLDRAFANASDEDLNAAVETLNDEHREAMDELVGGTADATTIRASIAGGRLDGTMESAALVLTDSCLAECIESLGEHADHPSSEQLRGVVPDLVEHHGKAMTQLMLASTVAGEAPASAIIRDLLKNDDDIKLPPAAPKPMSPIVQAPEVDPTERAAIKAKRKDMKQRKQDEARRRREQADAARNR